MTPENRALHGITPCWLGAGVWPGEQTMAFDDALLTWLCQQPALTPPVLLARTYQWQRPTVSLGVHQPASDYARLQARFCSVSARPVAWVRRPTGGRAIFHDRDISFSFVCNASALLQGRVADSYRVLCGLLAQTLQAVGIDARPCTQSPRDRDYTRSPICFETHTASDLFGANGQKVSGGAQLRRAGGLLHQGTVFLEPFGVSGDAFSQALEATLRRALGPAELCQTAVTQHASFQALLAARQHAYQSADLTGVWAYSPDEISMQPAS